MKPALLGALPDLAQARVGLDAVLGQRRLEHPAHARVLVLVLDLAAAAVDVAVDALAEQRTTRDGSASPSRQKSE